MKRSFTWNNRRRRSKPRHPGRVYVEKNGYGPGWQQAKFEALKRDDFTCQKCGKKGKRVKHRVTGKYRWTVHVHHKRKIAWFYDANKGEMDYEAANSLNNLITLCPNCHQAADGHKKLKGFKCFQ